MPKSIDVGIAKSNSLKRHLKQTLSTGVKKKRNAKGRMRRMQGGCGFLRVSPTEVC